MASLDGVEIPRRQWVVDGWLPSNAVTLIAGGGGVGKSLMTQQWLTAISLGINWLGTQTTAAVPTLFVNCEDEADEIARRNKDIAQALGFSIASLTDAHALSRAGELGNDLGTFDNDRNFKLSPFFHQIEAAALAIGAKVVGLDNVAHLFTGNENVRGEVTQFMNACTRLAMHIGGAVVLLGHPAKVEGSQSDLACFCSAPTKRMVRKLTRMSAF
jgi:RecA-family ATPase